MPRDQGRPSKQENKQLHLLKSHRLYGYTHNIALIPFTAKKTTVIAVMLKTTKAEITRAVIV